jgi:two-component system, NarL family, nitrate/nitrite response regulator NarL
VWAKLPTLIDIVIAGPQPVVLCGLIAMLHTEQDLKVVASCRDRVTSLQAIRDLLPDLAVVDSCLPDEGALYVLRAVRFEKLCTRVIVLSGPGSPSGAARLMREGAYRILSRETSLDALVRCLREVHCGPSSPSVPKLLNGHSVAQALAGDLSNVLTERERQIMHLVCEGLSNKDIGRQFSVSDGTVKAHLHNIYEKLAIHNRTALAALAARNPSWRGRGAESKSTESINLND